MSGLQSRIELLGYDRVYKKFRDAPEDVQAKAVEVIGQQAGPMVVAMRGATFTPIQRHAVRSLSLHKDRLGVSLVGAAAGTALDRVLYYGGEYGGRKSKKVVYATRSRRGRAYVVRRRTTMQFLPHLGREGYFMWPTVREWLPKINKAIGESVAKVLT